MDKAQDRILLTILSAALIFGAQAVFEYIKKRKADAKARHTRRPASALASDKFKVQRPAPFVDYELTQPAAEPSTTSAETYKPVEIASSYSSEQPADCITVGNPTVDDLRHIVIWSEILNRKYD